MARILAISSHVVRGHVGLDATVPALQWLGHEVWALPTVTMSSRPGLGRLVRTDTPAAELQGMLDALEQDGCWPGVDAVLTGYFGSNGAVTAAARAIAGIRKANPKVVVLVDPILGDGGRLYVADDVANAIRHELIPLAGIATPNLFELTWLTGRTPHDLETVAQAARQLGPTAVVVTSAQETDQSVTTLLVEGTHAVPHVMPRRSRIPNGAGDLFAGLFLAHLLTTPGATTAALNASLAALSRVLQASEGRDVLQLSALNTSGMASP